MKLRWNIGAATILAGLLILPAGPASACPRTLVVDDDGGQCPGATYTAIQPSIKAAHHGDTVRVCGGVYTGDVTINKAVNLVAQTPAAPAVDCVADAAADAASTTIIGAVVLTGTGATVDGFVVTGASTGITSSEQGSGYQIRRNVVESNRDFGIELQSGGQRQTIVGQLRTGQRHRIAARRDRVGERGPAERGHPRQHHRAQLQSISVDGAFPHTDISISGNTIRQESYGLVVSGTVGSDLTGNDIDFTGFASPATGIVVGEERRVGGHLEHRCRGVSWLVLPKHRNGSPPSVAVYVATNTFRKNVGTAISSLGSGNVGRSLLYRNVLTGNTGSGIFLNVGDDGNALIGNQVHQQRPRHQPRRRHQHPSRGKHNE